MDLHGRLVWRADTDKAHRCPGRSLPTGHPHECDGYVSCEETEWYFRRLHVYRCGKCGMKVTVFPGWPHYPGTESYRWRFWWFWTRGLRYRAAWYRHVTGKWLRRHGCAPVVDRAEDAWWRLRDASWHLRAGRKK